MRVRSIEPNKEDRRLDRLERKARKRHKKSPPKHPLRVTLVLAPSMYLTRGQESLELDGVPQPFGVEVEEVYDPLPSFMSSFSFDMDATGSALDSLGLGVDPLRWMRDNNIEFYQPFAIEYDYSVYTSYEGEYDCWLDYKIVWRSPKLGEARERLGLWVQRCILLAMLETRTTWAALVSSSG